MCQTCPPCERWAATAAAARPGAGPRTLKSGKGLEGGSRHTGSTRIAGRICVGGLVWKSALEVAATAVVAKSRSVEAVERPCSGWCRPRLPPVPSAEVGATTEGR